MRCRTDLLWIRSVAAVAVCFFLSAGAARGQQAAGIMGQVTDENGGVLPGVTVTATSAASTALYFYDYAFGFTLLLALSLAQIVL